jgi:hypothetical protein
MEPVGRFGEHFGAYLPEHLISVVRKTGKVHISNLVHAVMIENERC